MWTKIDSQKFKKGAAKAPFFCLNAAFEMKSNLARLPLKSNARNFDWVLLKVKYLIISTSVNFRNLIGGKL